MSVEATKPVTRCRNYSSISGLGGEGCRENEAPSQAAKSELNENHMNQHITLDQPNGIEGTVRKKTRNRRPLPAPETRDWMTANETALALGCSVATLHRLRRRSIPGTEPLPCSRYGRKSIFRKASITRWQDNNEKRGAE
jgi:hypothetical protein